MTQLTFMYLISVVLTLLTVYDPINSSVVLVTDVDQNRNIFTTKCGNNETTKQMLLQNVEMVMSF